MSTNCIQAPWYRYRYLLQENVNGTGKKKYLPRDRDTRFELAKSGIIGKILMSRAHGRPLKNFEVFLYIFNYYFKKLSGTYLLAKIMPIANVNRIVFVN